MSVVFALYPQNPQLMLLPIWSGVGIWLYVASKAELTEDEKPHRLKILLRMGWTVFAIAIGAHLTLFAITSYSHPS